ncbi:hypothetical protein J6590_019846 [Homalodisca vitripennis]|nr:hypothetical protein J6590_019846 [Homalodisca vitripennis]
MDAIKNRGEDEGKKEATATGGQEHGGERERIRGPTAVFSRPQLPLSLSEMSNTDNNKNLIVRSVVVVVMAMACHRGRFWHPHFSRRAEPQPHAVLLMEIFVNWYNRGSACQMEFSLLKTNWRRGVGPLPAHRWQDPSQDCGDMWDHKQLHVQLQQCRGQADNSGWPLSGNSGGNSTVIPPCLVAHLRETYIITERQLVRAFKVQLMPCSRVRTMFRHEVIDYTYFQRKISV